MGNGGNGHKGHDGQNGGADTVHTCSAGNHLKTKKFRLCTAFFIYVGVSESDTPTHTIIDSSGVKSNSIWDGVIIDQTVFGVLLSSGHADPVSITLLVLHQQISFLQCVNR